jgi:hypothetical protein
MEEIDRVILELQGVRDTLRSEGERVSRDISGYASLSHASMSAMRVIGTKRASVFAMRMSAFGGKADIANFTAGRVSPFVISACYFQ